MECKEIKQLIEKTLEGSSAHVEGDGYHFQATVTSSAFNGLTRVKQQQLVYTALREVIADGRLHAISIKTQTP